MLYFRVQVPKGPILAKNGHFEKIFWRLLRGQIFLCFQIAFMINGKCIRMFSLQKIIAPSTLLGVLEPD